MRTGWSGEDIEAALDQREADRRLLLAWYRKQRPPDPIHWSIAPEYNVFPDEVEVQ